MNRYALPIGINRYGHGADLAGCVNDALDWQAVLIRRGWSVPTMLLDGDATRANILDGLTELLARARYRDRIFVPYSGHGTYVPDRDGDEADGRDEALCNVDLWDAGPITDDDLYAAVSQARHGVRVVVAADCCYSGTLQRAVGPGVPFGALGPPRFLPPARWADLDTRPRAWQAAENATPKGKPRRGALVLSGCASTEVSYDASFAGRPNGAFTRAAIDALTDFGGARPTYQQWHDATRKRLPSADYPQTPQLDGTAYQRRIWTALD